jgi:hypothetical protein
MSETIDAIQEKLRPGNIVAGATDRVKNATTERVRKMAGSASETAQGAMESTREMAGNLAEGARQNAIPAAMIGIGVAWLLIDRFRDRRDRDWRQYESRGYASSYRTPGYYGGDEYYRARASSPYGTGYSEYGSSDYDAENRTPADYEEGLSSRVEDVRERALRTGRRARGGFERLLHSNPLMVGAAALAVGAAVGLALPETERENEWMGEARDNVVERAQDLARNAATRAQDAVGDAATEVASRVVSGKESGTDKP